MLIGKLYLNINIFRKTKTMTINRGSEWRKWDLHIHTPASINQNYGNNYDSWEKFINALENLPTDVQVIGITDYYFIMVMKW